MINMDFNQVHHYKEMLVLMNATIDLHLHSTASDGASKPLDLLDEVQAVGLKYISFTDHESMEGMKGIDQEALRHGLIVIPGVELLTYYREQEIHVLGYWMEESGQFGSWLKDMRIQRNERYLQMVRRLREYGYDLDEGRFVDLANKQVALGKNHIIISLIKAGYITSKEQAVDMLRRYLSPHGLAYPDFDFNPFMEAVQVIRECGGIPILAHPGLVRDDRLVVELLEVSGAGLEVYYYYFGDKNRQLVKHYEQMAAERGLTLVTGGSDYHGRFSPDIKLGRVPVPDEVATRLEMQRFGEESWL
jgi:predicted metal-dependent phosphoesterase TrpH